MRSPEAAMGRIRNGSKRRDIQTKRVFWSFYKKQIRNEKMKKMKYF